MSDWLGLGTTSAALIDAGVSVYNNERNIDFARSNLNYQKNLQKQIFAREDNAVQRRAADLKAAGFNPLLAAGGAASSGAAINTTAPQSNMKTNFAEVALALRKQQIDLSMTRSQQQLIREQVEQQRKNNELLGMTIQWYKDHPGYAPNVDSGLYTGKGLSSIFDNIGGRLTGFIDDVSNEINTRVERAEQQYKYDREPDSAKIKRVADYRMEVMHEKPNVAYARAADFVIKMKKIKEKRL